VLEAKTDVLTSNAMTDEGNFAFACRPTVASLLATKQGFSTLVPLWTGPLDSGQLRGNPAFSSMVAPADTLIGGDWRQLMILEWGSSLQIKVNPYANFQAEIIAYAAFISIDVAVLEPKAFSVATGVS
jgi:hypothetical protein